MMFENSNTIYDCVILGAGPAGLSSALYCARGNVNCAIIDTSCLGGAPMNYCDIENYLGFQKLSGYELAQNFVRHVQNFDIPKFEYEEIEYTSLKDEIKKIKTYDREFLTHSVILATGAKPKKLGIQGEEEFLGRGVSYCAVCDGAFYKDKVVAVVGGGNSALDEAIYLSQFAKKVYIIHRRDTLRADKIAQKRVFENKKIELILNFTPVEIKGEKKVEEIILKNVLDNSTSPLKIDGVFPYIGLEANSKLFQEEIETDKNGFILTDKYMKTNLKNVYAIGDVRNTPLRQVITAVSDGAIAGVEVSKNISILKEKVKVQ